MNDDWNTPARHGFGWGVPLAAGRSARPALPFRPAGHPESGVRFLLVTDDEALAATLQLRLHRAGHAAHWQRQLPASALAGDHEALVVDGALWRAAQAAGAADTVASLPMLLLDEPEQQPGTGLAARLEAVADRVLAWAERATPRAGRRLMGGELLVDVDRQFIQLNGVTVELTPFEWQVIRLLANRPDRVVSRAEIAQLIGGDASASDNAVAVHLYNLRRKLGRHAIETIRGRGFRLRP